MIGTTESDMMFCQLFAGFFVPAVPPNQLQSDYVVNSTRASYVSAQGQDAFASHIGIPVDVA